MTAKFDKSFEKSDHYTQKMIAARIDKHIDGTDDLRQHGKSLTGDQSGLWRYKIVDYRLVCAIEDEKPVILALAVGHRRDVYQ